MCFLFFFQKQTKDTKRRTHTHQGSFDVHDEMKKGARTPTGGSMLMHDSA
jgi:hypothetical protein